MTIKPLLANQRTALAIWEGRQTQHRVPITALRTFGRITQFGPSDTPGYSWTFRDRELRWNDIDEKRLRETLPYAVGDLLYVREPWWIINAMSEAGRYEMCVGYSADGDELPNRPTIPVSEEEYEKWSARLMRGPYKSRSIHMPRWASRMTLTVADVRVQRVQDISTLDALDEGIVQTWGEFYGSPPKWALRPGENGGHFYDNRTSIENFGLLWDSLYGAQGRGWDANPWVCAITFTMERRNVDA